MRGCVAILFSLATALASHVASAAGDDLGVVLLHGKGGLPTGISANWPPPFKAGAISCPLPRCLGQRTGSTTPRSRKRWPRSIATSTHAKSKFVTVTADHFTVPTAAIEEVVTWLVALRQ